MQPRRTRPDPTWQAVGSDRSGWTEGFTVIEALVAVTILLIAVMLSIQPIMMAIRRSDDSRAVSVSQHLAQSEIEAIRSLDYEDVGIPGRTPSGVLAETKTVEVEGRSYVVDMVVSYAGSLTGLDVIPQGGDGVEGAWDPGVDYKVVRVTVAGPSSGSGPVMMETIVAPPNIGAHEAIANARVSLVAHEPFAEGGFLYPQLRVHDAPAAPIASWTRDAVQVFPAIPPGSYTVELGVADGWVIHPEDIEEGLDTLEVSPGTLAETSLRVYKPSRLLLSVIDSATQEPLTDARLTLTHIPSGEMRSFSPGEYVIEGLMPDSYDIVVSATGYHDFADGSVNIPEDYPDLDHELVVSLDQIVTTTTTTTTTTVPSTTTTVPGTTTTTSTTTTMPGGDQVSVLITVRDNTDRRVHGARVEIPHPTRGLLTATTDSWGRAYFDLEAGISFTATGSTTWGHGPDSETFDPAQTTDVTLRLTRPSYRGTYVLSGGTDAEFQYRPYGSDYYVTLPANKDGEASFVGYEGWYRVRKRCLGDGDIEGDAWVYVRRNENRYSTIWGWCP